jgi:hypothetical protein
MVVVGTGSDADTDTAPDATRAAAPVVVATPTGGDDVSL